MIVGISMRLATSGYGEERDALSHDWIRLLTILGVTPLLIPNRLENPVDYARQLGMERLLLTGGDNVGSTTAGEPQTPRDKTESSLLAWALEDSLPVLGVCRGLQFINMAFGGGITRDLATAVPDERHVATSHPVQLTTGETITVNSYHNEGILLSQVAPRLQVFAMSPAGIVEALTLPGKRLTAIQWHPERPSPSTTYDRKLLEGWLYPA